MNAREYFKDQWGLNDMDMFSDIFSGIDMVEFAKEYHQAKSNAKPSREEAISLIEAFLRFLHDNGYTDSDVYDERPTAVDQFMQEYSEYFKWWLEPVEITEEEIAKFVIDWGITFAPDECVEDDLEWKEYAIALSFAQDLLTKLKNG